MQWLLWLLTSSVPREDRRAAFELAKVKLNMHPAAAWRLGVVFLIWTIAVIFAVREHSIQLIASILGGGALAVAYIEWLLGRRESSMDKFYERLRIANDYRRAVKSPCELAITEVSLYVFSELDNLEYVIERYRFGYMSAALALRGIKTFESRVKEIPGFAKLVEELSPGAGYSQHTQMLVDVLLNKAAPQAPEP